jgi:hypothetical protein
MTRLALKSLVNASSRSAPTRAIRP